MKHRSGRLCLVGAMLWAALAIPAVRHVLESTMTLQMLIQIPLLALAGGWLAQGAPGWLVRRLHAWNHRGISGLLLASLTGMVWMLPLAMDAALDDPQVRLAKFLSVPLLIGAPIALSWPRAGFVVRGVVLVELIATMMRLGWLYLISPIRLCSNYLLDDQQRLGKILLVAGFAILLVLVWKLVWGHVDSGRADREDARIGSD
ncbi:hypothetical protein B0E47_10270 [Rhodanobacter sp. B05]|uniref:hypothetical protein n=1 Tax=Rhodanobacter sp. B05 TaxID=1945859 RepID=UPI00098445E9|nr:hypothetical protein [Rhodanobacter sp. B05]OOG55170.1 hypothetical protein B0E47_10270 [Rhodanobacter sp. B05]